MVIAQMLMAQAIMLMVIMLLQSALFGTDNVTAVDIANNNIGIKLKLQTS